MITNIEKLRKGKWISQKEIAEKIGTTRQTFSKMAKWEVEPTLWQAVKLAEMLWIEVNDFLSSDTQINAKKWIDWEKYKQIITNFITHWSDNDWKITKTKLAKLCYLLDFSWYYYNLTSITWLEYRKIKHWPVPDAYFTTIDELQEEESIAIEMTWKSYMIKNIWIAKSDKLSEDELELLKKISLKWKNKNTLEIVDFTHHQLPWMICYDKEVIPYGLITQEELENVY